MLNEIYLDLDDTLNNFTQELSQHYGIEGSIWDWYKPSYGYDIFRAIYHNSPNPPKTRAEFWESIGFQFWEELAPIDELDEILHLADLLVGRENVFIVTHVTQCPESSYGKHAWIKKNIPDWVRFFICEEKSKLARKGRLLVDDHEENIDKWSDAGGEVVISNRPWNCETNSLLDEMELLKSLL